MNASDPNEAILQAQKRISELEDEIRGLKEEGQHKPEFSQGLAKLMKKYKLDPAEVIALLLIRGDIDQRAFTMETVIKLRYVLGLKDFEASHSSEKPFRVSEWVNVNVQ